MITTSTGSLSLLSTVILPRLRYFSVVWSPFLKRDVHLLQSAQRRFLRRVTARCGHCADVGSFPSVMSLHKQADNRVFNRLYAMGDIDRFFEVHRNSRQGPSYKTETVACSDLLNNTFANRNASSFRPDYKSIVSLVP